MRKLWCLLIGLVLAGCATFEDMKLGLNHLIGKADREAFAVLGYPMAKQEFGDDVVYSWYVNTSSTVFIPQTASTTSFVGNRTVYGTTSYTQAIPVSYNCQVRIISGKDGIIRSWEYDGNMGGCERYIDRLKKYYEAERAAGR